MSAIAEFDLEHIEASVLEALMAARPADSRLNMSTSREGAERRLLELIAAEPTAVEPLQVHHRIRSGLPGTAILTAASLVYDTVDEVTAFFSMTPKTLRERVRQDRLSTDESERAVRIGRVALAAAQALGSFDLGRRYLRTRNFALGGATPLDLMHTAEGERIVLDELQAHADSGPL